MTFDNRSNGVSIKGHSPKTVRSNDAHSCPSHRVSPSAHHWPLTVQLSACPPSTFHCPPTTVHRLPSTVHRPPSDAHCPPPVLRLSTVHPSTPYPPHVPPTDLQVDGLVSGVEQRQPEVPRRAAGRHQAEVEPLQRTEEARLGRHLHLHRQHQVVVTRLRAVGFYPVRWNKVVRGEIMTQTARDRV